MNVFLLFNYALSLHRSLLELQTIFVMNGKFFYIQINRIRFFFFWYYLCTFKLNEFVTNNKIIQ